MASVLDDNHDSLSYSSILATIIETNVTIEYLAEFKKVVTSDCNEMITILEEYANHTPEKANQLFAALLFHAYGLNNSCNINPHIKDAMLMAGLPKFKIDFNQAFKEFMVMCLKDFK